MFTSLVIHTPNNEVEVLRLHGFYKTKFIKFKCVQKARLATRHDVTTREEELNWAATAETWPWQLDVASMASGSCTAGHRKQFTASSSRTLVEMFTVSGEIRSYLG